MLNECQVLSSFENMAMQASGAADMIIELTGEQLGC